jgi:outer membrane murein-binding lipoprotein Lpp
VKNWRTGMTALDDWTLPAIPRAPLQWQPVLKWAAAAAILLVIGFALGRQNSSVARDVADLKTSVAQLQNDRALNTANTVAAATDAANKEFARLLTDYAKQDGERRAEDRRTFALALSELDSRLVKLRAELETVAVNTQDGFYQTQQGLTELVSIAASDGNKSDRTP